MHPFSTSPAEHLKDEHDAMACLLEFIKQEEMHLIEANIDNLSRTTEEKTKIIGKIAELAKFRHNALETAGYAPSDASMQTWLENAPNKAAYQMWSKVLEIAQAAKELNRTNGLLINQHLTRNRNALSVLQGAGEGDNFYGPTGHSTTKPSPRRLVIG
jgi:flagellar biosynthesis protein FlgN